MAASVSPPCPTRILAGISVPDTPLVQDALDYARDHSTTGVYNHVVRSWLFGSVISSKVPAFQNIDKELHAVAAILHDLGWDPTGALVTPDKRFEVDGADAARLFLKSKAPDWHEHKLQLLWETIALHTTPSIAKYKEAVVALTGIGIAADFSGPNNVSAPGLTWEGWNGIVETFPRTGFVGEVRDIAVHLCQTKRRRRGTTGLGRLERNTFLGSVWSDTALSISSNQVSLDSGPKLATLCLNGGIRDQRFCYNSRFSLCSK